MRPGFSLLGTSLETGLVSQASNENLALTKISIDTSFDLIINRHTAIHMGLYDNIQVTESFLTHVIFP